MYISMYSYVWLISSLNRVELIMLLSVNFAEKDK